MIQRIQSVYLLVAAVVSVVCLCLQIGTFQAGDMVVAREYNMFSVVTADSYYSFSQWPLFVVLLLSVAIGLYTIFQYRNRKLQARLCVFCELLVVGWYVLYAVFGKLLTYGNADVTFVPSLTASLPVISFVLYVLARRGIKADERLVRAADRIR